MTDPSKPRPPRPRLADLTKPIQSDEPPPPDVGTAPETLWEALFPIDTDSHGAQLFGMEKRVAHRLRTGYSRTPPKITEKLERQVAAKAQLAIDISAALDRAEAAGIHIDVVRYTLHSFLKSERLDQDQEPL